MKPSRALPLFLILSSILLVLGAILSLMFGAKIISPQTIWEALLTPNDTLDHSLILTVRLPRVLSTILVGGLLGISGILMQKVTRNPIAEPSTLGISQGATLAISVLYLNQTWVTSENILFASLLGSIVAGAFLLLFLLKGAAMQSIGKLLLAGTALSTFFLSLSTIIGIITNNTQMISFLIGGGFRNTTWQQVVQLSLLCVLALPPLFYFSSRINTLSLGDEICIGLGQQPSNIRFWLVVLVILFTAMCVAVAKNISFVGLIIPVITMHIVSLDIRKQLPCSFLAGGVLLVFADLLARTLLQPYETPIGIFTALLGIPFFLYLIRKEHS